MSCSCSGTPRKRETKTTSMIEGFNIMNGGTTRLTASASGISVMYGTGSSSGGVTRDRPERRRGGIGGASASPATPLTPVSRTSPTATWGPLLWNAIHTLTWYDLSDGVLEGCWDHFVDVLVEHLPCAECAGHLREWIAERPLVAGAHGWFVDLHNRINVRQQKPEWTAAAVGEHYGRHVDPGITLINLYTGLGDLDDYMDEAVSVCLRQIIDVLMQ
jgi:hypothetical protein